MRLLNLLDLFIQGSVLFLVFFLVVNFISFFDVHFVTIFAGSASADARLFAFKKNFEKAALPSTQSKEKKKETNKRSEDGVAPAGRTQE